MDRLKRHLLAFRAEGPLALSFGRWWAAVRSIFPKFGEDNLNLVAGGVAFFGFLSIFPALIAIVSVLGVATDPGGILVITEPMQEILPPGVVDLLTQELTRVTGREQGTLALATIIATVFAFWSSNRGMANFCSALTIVHDERHHRSWPRHVAVSFVLTLLLMAVFLAALATIVGVPLLVAELPLGPLAALASRSGQWVLLFFLMAFAATAVFKWGPDRSTPRWRWAYPGAVIATACWLMLSLLFSLFVQNFSAYSRIYGSLAAVTVMMLWFYLSAFVFLLGAELNAALEKQSLGDSTEGMPQKPGRRDAVPADTFPPEALSDAARHALAEDNDAVIGDGR